MINNFKLIFIFLLFILIGILIFIFFFNQKPKKTNIPLPIYISPTITTSQPKPLITQDSPTISPTLTQQEIIQYEAPGEFSYAEDQKKFLEEYPWFNQLPLKSKQYFIMYDTKNNQFLVTIYYSLTNSKPKAQQLAASKQAALEAIQSLGVDLQKQNIVYYEREEPK